jgi:hypothetical protein
MLDFVKYQRLAVRPRTITPELEKHVPILGWGQDVGCGLMAFGVLGTVVLVALAFFDVVGWPVVGVGVLLGVVGFVLSKATRGAGLAKGRVAMESVPIGLGAIVQANTRLYEPGDEGEYWPAIIVVAEGDAAHDASIVVGAADYLRSLKHAGSLDPAVYALASKMFDERSRFDESLPPTFHPSYTFRWFTTALPRRAVPGGVANPQSVIPLFLWSDQRPVPIPHELLR